MTDREAARFLRQHYTNNPQSRRAIRASKLRLRYGKDWDRLSSEVRRTREKLDILQEIQRDWEQRKIAEYEASQ